MSFCDLSEMNGDRFSRSSKGTDHSEGGSLLAATASHQVHVLKNGMWTESWPVDPEGMITFSKVLYDKISRDRDLDKTITTCEPEDPVSTDALHAILKAISRKDTGGRLASKSCSFEGMLDISVALWCLKCSTVLFESLATTVRSNAWSEAAEPGAMQYEGWMFIAFVFAWDDVFRQASRELISDYSRNDKLSKYLPKNIKGNPCHS